MPGNDRLRYQLMAKSLEEFEKGQRDLRGLIDDLYDLISALETADESCKEAFFSHWETLEEVYAAAAALGETELSPEDHKLIKKAFEGLKQLVNEALGK